MRHIHQELEALLGALSDIVAIATERALHAGKELLEDKPLTLIVHDSDSADVSWKSSLHLYSLDPVAIGAIIGDKVPIVAGTLLLRIVEEKTPPKGKISIVVDPLGYGARSPFVVTVRSPEIDVSRRYEMDSNGIYCAGKVVEPVRT